jgi:two-component system response regulator CpxR
MSVVLIVDDHRDTGRVLARLLRAEGFEPVAVESGQAALDFARETKRKLSIVLLDIMMPLMNGFQTLQQLRATPAGNVPVIMVTAILDEEHRQRAVELGAVDYWVKGTFDPGQLGEMIRRHISPT